MLGSIRVGNKRSGSPLKPLAGEIVIDGDRKNPILGNPYILHNPNDKDERMQVIASYNKDFFKDWEENGPKRKEVEKICDLVNKGKRVVLMCWCAPKKCHCDTIKDKVEEITKCSPHPTQLDLI
jgi:Domain of unknown function (DUF4326)